jgi:hypothetical protein
MKKLILIILALSLYGCATPYLENSLVSNEVPSKKVYLVASDTVNGEARVHNAFLKKLTERGFDVVDMKDQMPSSGDGVILKYKETWSWDFVMVISTIDVSLIDGKNKHILGTFYWGRGFFHNYPSPEDAVAQLMAEIDLKYVAGNADSETSPTTICTTDQILKMRDIGMTDRQIKDACD